MSPIDNYNPGQEAATVTAAPNLQTEVARNDPNDSANRLVQALGADSAQRGLAEYQQVTAQRKLQEQSMKVDGYTQQFMQDHQGGAVSQAQVQAQFPETVPVIAARIAESIGKKQGQLDVAQHIEEINNNDSLRLDTTQRAAFVAKARADLFAKIPQGNDFYAAGVVSAMDRAFGEQELKWQGQTAAFHQDVQKTTLLDEAVTALRSADPKSAMALIDDNYSRSSSLNNLERNKVYVDAVIKTASVAEDTSFLERIPQQYLNADSKDKIYKARIAITDEQFAKWRHAREFEAYQRSEADRVGMLGILGKLGRNEDVNPAQYFSSPTLHAFAVEAMSTPSVPEAASAAVVQAFRTKLLSSGNVDALGSQQSITSQVMALKGVNPKDRADLVNEVPKLMDGTVLMNAPEIRRAYTDHLSSRMDDLARSPSAQIQRLMGTGNLRGNAMSMFEGEIQANFEAAYRDPSGNGQWPTGVAARKIIDAAVAKTSAYVDKMTSLDGLRLHQSDAAPAPAIPATTPAPPSVVPSSLPKGVTKIK